LLFWCKFRSLLGLLVWCISNLHFLNEIVAFNGCYRLNFFSLGENKSTSELFWWKSVVSVCPYVINISQFWHHFHNNCMPSQQAYHKYSFRNSEESFQIDSNCEIALVSKSMTAVLASDWQNHFRYLLQNNLWSHQHCQKCSSGGLQVFFLLGEI
jgi:hypothetical protein